MTPEDRSVPPDHSWLARAVSRLHQMWRREDGLSAVEFALLSPLLVLGAFATVDAGMAVYEEMTITNALRSGAHIAAAASSEAQILSVINSVAAENFTLASGSPSSDDLTTSVASYCICPSVTSVQVSCVSVCSGGSTPQRFYTIAATKNFDGILLPSFTLSGSIDVIAQ